MKQIRKCMHLRLVFEERSERSKRRKSKELRKSVCFPELTHATKMNLQSAGKTRASRLFNASLETTQTKGFRIRKACGTHVKNILSPYTFEAHLTKKSIHKNSKSNNNEELQHLPKLSCN
jgi:hypothetical protein